jgi:hypothetical protein
MYFLRMLSRCLVAANLHIAEVNIAFGYVRVRNLGLLQDSDNNDEY